MIRPTTVERSPYNVRFGMSPLYFLVLLIPTVAAERTHQGDVAGAAVCYYSPAFNTFNHFLLCLLVILKISFASNLASNTDMVAKIIFPFLILTLSS